ncbi:MAG: chromate transporter [Armatimonadetes bacterium]|nr:chromate transporter [Armatimonadota bacterium]
MSLLQMFLTYLRIGATGFGGPMALIGMLQEQFVERKKAISSAEFAEGVAIGQILPGPIAIDAAVYVGYRLRGWLGAIAGAVGLILPPFLIMLVLTPLYFEFGKVPQAQGFFAGLRPAVVAVIAAASWRLGKRGLKDKSGYLIAATVMALSLIFGNAQELAQYLPAIEPVAARARDLGSIALIVLAGGLGLLLPVGQPAKPPPEGEAPAKGGAA